MTRRITQDDYKALAEVRYQIRRFLNFSEAAARGAGVEPQQHQLLLSLKGLPDSERPTIRVVAERLQIQHHSAVELATRSAERGLVRRAEGEHDRREVILQITVRGQTVLKQLSLAHRDELRSAAPLLVRALGALVAAEPDRGR